MEKKISIIVPCYNVERYISRCLKSLTAQTIGVDYLEIICVDDASTDGTVKKLQAWEEKYPDSIMVVLCEENGRQGTARNIGLSYASTPYIGYVDSDDWVDVTMFEKLYRAAQTHGAEVTSCLGGRDRGTGEIYSVISYQGQKEKLIEINTVQEREEFLLNPIGPVWTKLYKRDFLLNHDIYFMEGVAYEDNFFGTLMSFYVTSFYLLDEALYHYYTNMNSTVSRRNSPQHYERLIVEKALLKELDSRGFMGDYEQYIKGRFLHMFYLNSMHAFLTKYDVLPYAWLEELKTETLEILPDYKEIKAYGEMTDLEKAFLLPLDTDMSKELWGNMAENYQTIICANHKIE